MRVERQGWERNRKDVTLAPDPAFAPTLSPADLAACYACSEEGAREAVLAIVEAVAAAIPNGVTVAAILGKYRGKASVARARQIVMYIADRDGISHSAIGRALGRDHSSVGHGVKAEKARRGEIESPGTL